MLHILAMWPVSKNAQTHLSVSVLGVSHKGKKCDRTLDTTMLPIHSNQTSSPGAQTAIFSSYWVYSLLMGAPLNMCCSVSLLPPCVSSCSAIDIKLLCQRFENCFSLLEESFRNIKKAMDQTFILKES